jgi:hypothetical protein
MKSLVSFFLLALLAIPATVQAQGSSKNEIPYAEIFAGYSYLNANMNGFNESRQHLNGWKLALSTPLKPYFSLDYEVSGNYAHMMLPISLLDQEIFGLPQKVKAAVKDYTVFFGPRVSHGPFFAHAMIGGDCLLGKALGESESEWSLSGAFGGGIQIPVTKLVSFRGSLDYELAKHSLLGSPTQLAGSYEFTPSLMENNFRVSAGLIFNIRKK